MAGAGGGIAIAGANMWAVLRNNDPGHSADDAVVHGRKLVKKAAAKAEEVAPPPRAESVAAKPATKRGTKKGTKKATKRGAAGDGKHKQAAPAGTMDDMMERFTRIAMAAIYGKQMPLEAPPAVPAIPGLLPEHQPGGGEVKETPAAAAPSEEEEEEVVGIEWEYEEMGKVEEEGEFVAVVAKGGTVAQRRRARKAAAAEGAGAGGTNMWAVLGDDDPGHGAAYGRRHKKAATEVEEKMALADNVGGSACSGSGDGGAKPAKRGKKTKKKKKCAVEAEDSKQAATMDDGEIKAEDNKQAVAVTVDDGDGGCRAVARAIVAAAVIALWCRLVSPF